MCNSFGLRVDAGQVARFVGVAKIAGKREVVQGVGAAMLRGKNVFHLERNERLMFLPEPTVFADCVCALTDELFRFRFIAFSCGGVPVQHGLWLEESQ